MTARPRMPESDELSAALRVAPAGLDGRALCAAGLVASAEAERVLDIGCKSGWLLRHLAQQPRRPGVIVGIDLELNDEAARGRSGFELTRADARRLPFDDASFDLVAALDSIEHVPARDERSIVSDIARMLRPGGTSCSPHQRTGGSGPGPTRSAGSSVVATIAWRTWSHGSTRSGSTWS